MFKIIFLIFVSNTFVISQAFFISGRDIRKFFGFVPSFYEFYKKEASQNDQENYYNYNRDPHIQTVNKKYEENINEKLNHDRHYSRKTDPYEYDTEYSSKKENIKPYKHEHKNCEQDEHKNKDIRVYDTFKRYPQFNGKLQNHPHSVKVLKYEDILRNEDETSKKDYITGILVTLPNFKSKNTFNDHDQNQNKREKLYIKTYGSTSSSVFDEEYPPPENIFI